MRHNTDVDAGDLITIRDARLDDARAILDVQREAFLPASRRYKDLRLPPLLERIEDVEHDIREHTVLVAEESDGRMVGAVRGREGDGCVYVGRLVVEPASQRRGIATALMRELEGRFPDAECFELFTGGLNEPGMGLYLKLGYRETRRERESELLEIVYLRKDMAPGSERVDGGTG
jgi:ribosomal protein S18 acetylase RimI-like enzyme